MLQSSLSIFSKLFFEFNHKKYVQDKLTCLYNEAYYIATNTVPNDSFKRI